MPKEPKDEEIEARIHDEIVVDAYDEYERASGWHCYLEDQIEFPFLAKVTKRERTSPLEVGTTINVCGMAPQEDCDNRMRATVSYNSRELDVPLEQLTPVDDIDDENTRNAIFAWHYWVARGYQF